MSEGIGKAIVHEVAECLIQTSLRGVDSHGIRLLPHYIRVAKSGRINKEPNCSFTKTSPTTGIYDADHTYGHAAASFALKMIDGAPRRCRECVDEAGYQLYFLSLTA